MTTNKLPPLSILGDPKSSPLLASEKVVGKSLPTRTIARRARLGDKEAIESILEYALQSDDRDWLEKGAALGDVDCERRCAEMEMNEGLSRIRALDELAETDPQIEIHAMHELEKLRTTSTKRMLALAESGDAEAMQLYGMRLVEVEEEEFPTDYEEGTLWLFKALKAGAYPEPAALLFNWSLIEDEVHYSELLEMYVCHPRFDNDPHVLLEYAIALECGCNIAVDIEKAGYYYLRAAHFGSDLQQRQWYLYRLRTNPTQVMESVQDTEDGAITMPGLGSWKGWTVENLIESPTPLTLLFALANPTHDQTPQLATSLADTIFDSLRRSENLEEISGELFFWGTDSMFEGDVRSPPSAVRGYRPMLDALEKSLPATLGDADTLQSAWQKCWPAGYLLAVCAFDFQDDQDTFQRWISYLNYAKDHDPLACALLGYLHYSGKIRNANLTRARDSFENFRAWGEYKKKDWTKTVSESRKDRFWKTSEWVYGLLLALRESQVREQTTQEMLSYLTHTMKNLFASSPEQARQVMATLGSQMYEGRKSEHMAILNAGRMYSTFIYAQQLASTFKLYISEPDLLREKWRTDKTGSSSVQGVLAFAVNECLSQLIFQTDYQNALEDLLPTDIEAKRQIRKSFTEEIVPLSFDESNTQILLQWIGLHIRRLRIEVEPEPDARFAANGTRYAFLFSCFAELITNSFKHVAAQGEIHISWRREDASFVFSVTNHRAVIADSYGGVSGSGRGLDFVRRAAQAVGAHLGTDFTSDPCEAKLVMPISMWES